ncbi:MAG TPA: Mrp/NBP35 family ATP-binding protein [Petrotogaceae bacterium]|nr:Mrp/NBP35 family ATP-binding protein [Petrotogaceae bacterium]HQF33500.1 Mrp/NBP35 family ATP-binding protein [Petrotogaceae bacterium]
MENPVNAMIEKAQNTMKNISHKIVVMSGKGGVGKSTVAVNLAVALALEGRKVGLLDIDLHGPDVVRMLGGDSAKPYQVGNDVQPPEINGIKVISTSQFLKDETSPIVWRGPLKTSAILEFLGDIAWGELDYLIMDCPPGTGDELLTVFQNFKDIDGTLIVTTPSVVSQDDVEKAINFSKMMNVNILGLVENMSYFVCEKCGEKHYIFGQDGGKTLAEKYNLELLQEIPINKIIRSNMDKGQPAAYFGVPDTVAPFINLAKKIIGKTEK